MKLVFFMSLLELECNRIVQKWEDVTDREEILSHRDGSPDLRGTTRKRKLLLNEGL